MELAMTIFFSRFIRKNIIKFVYYKTITENSNNKIENSTIIIPTFRELGHTHDRPKDCKKQIVLKITTTP